MLTFKYVYDGTVRYALTNMLLVHSGYCFNLETYDINHYKERKKAFKIKGSCSARETPFLAVYDGDKLVKAFYTEVNECNWETVSKWLQEYFTSNGKKGFITITKLEGIKNDEFTLGSSHSGYTSAFIEGLPLKISCQDEWYCTSNVVEIDWENERFKTKNSTYSFKFNASPSN